MRRLILFSIILFLSVSVYASDEQKSHFLVINDFSGGLNSHVSEFNVGKNQVADALNVRFNDEYSNVSKRATLISAGDVGSSKVTGGHRLYTTSGIEKNIVSIGTELHVESSSDTYIIGRDGLTDGKRWAFVTYKDNEIGTNGYDSPIKWDGSTSITANTAGHRTALNLFADLGGCFADLTTGTNLSASSSYQYTVLFRDDDADIFYYTDSKSNPISTGADVYTIALTDIPIGKNGVDQRQIYRTEAQSSIANAEAVPLTSYKLVATLADNSTTTYKDIIADGSLGVALSVSGHTNVTPPKCKYSLIHKRYLFLAGDPYYPSNLYSSDEYNPDWFLATDFEKVRPDDGDEITFIKDLYGVCVVGKTNSIVKYNTDGSVKTNWGTTSPFSHIGCPSPYSVENTPKGLMYLGRHGLYLFNNYNSQLISDAMTPDVLDVNQSNIEEAFGIYWNNEYQIAYASEANGAAENDSVLVYDLIRDAYTKDSKTINCMWKLEAGNDFGVLYSGTSESDGVIFKEGATENALVIKYKTDLDDGTFDDCRSFGTENAPTLKLAWDLTWGADFQTLGYLTMGNMVTQTYAREDTDGSWISPVYYISGDSVDKLYWNENLNATGDVEFQMRFGASSAACQSAAWGTQYTDPSGSDVSSETANDYMQLRANLSTSNIVNTSELFVSDNYLAKLVYSKEGAAYESSVNSYIKTGWIEPAQGYEVTLQWIKVYYQGTSGTMTIRMQNLITGAGAVDKTFDIDISKEPPYTTDLGDTYDGAEGFKVFKYICEEDEDIGQFWKFTIQETGVIGWKVDRMEIMVWINELPQ